ncbi:hypothetical protein ABZ923_26860 [Streptomyces sp. NPDC046881]|uniref:hypothetical protein n=1 Tax=Streptomyces sp. NPDC046881 TaxID=3155374 RepID=UPI0034067577
MDRHQGLHHHGDGDPTLGSHGMLLLGGEFFHMSHLPMFRSPHNFRVVLEVGLADTAASVVRSHRHLVPEEPYDTYVPDDFPMSELDPRGSGPRRTSMTGKLVCGHFEREGGQHPPLAERTVVTVQNVVHFAELDVRAKHRDDGELGYLCFGRGGRLYLAHVITGAPDFDQVLTVRTVPGTATDPLGQRLPDDDATLEKFFAERFAVAERVGILGRTDEPDRRVVPPQTVDGAFSVAPPSGVHGFRVRLEAQREVYMETGDLREPGHHHG